MPQIYMDFKVYVYEKFIDIFFRVEEDELHIFTQKKEKKP